MVERNLISEGFVSNTLAPDGSVSGTQVVSIPEINALVDEDFSTTALSISGSEFISLDADLGGRWKLSRIDLYTNEPSNSNFDIYVSDDGSDYYPITLTGSAGLWSGPVSGTTVSGAPRYLRYEHQPSVLRTVQEWRAVSDDSLVDFGSDGTQTSAAIDSAPIGRPSDQVTELVLFNKYDKEVQGFVFIDETGNAGDDNVEISTSSSGPWFGRKNQSSRQPSPTPWREVDYFGDVIGDIYEGESVSLFNNVRVVSGTAYRTDFTGTTSRGWTTSGFTSNEVVGGTFRGNISSSTVPAFHFDNDFGNTSANSPDSAEALTNGFVPFRSEDYDTVEISLTTPTLVATDLVEGPRLFWRDHTAADYDSTRSVVSTTAGANFTGAPQNFTFNVGQVPTWSGAIRGLKIQNYTTTTGLAITSSLNSLEVFYTGKSDRVALDFSPVISGSFIGIYDGTETSGDEYFTVINTENPVKEPCIITSVSAKIRPTPSTDAAGWFLVRFANGFTYNDRADELNAFVTITGAPFEVVHFVAQDESYSKDNTAFFTRYPVLWRAEPGDMVGFAYRTFAGGSPFQDTIFAYDTNLTTTTGGAIASDQLLDIQDSQTNAGVTADLNTFSDWVTTGRRINIQFKAISAGDYVANGTYTTPIFDGGGDPALLSFIFSSVEENGTSIDVSGSAAFDTVNARASSIPANTSTALGRRVNQFAVGAHPSDHPSVLNPASSSPYILGYFNSEVTAREDITGPLGDDNIENFASNILYREDNDELWLLNVLISGTSSDNLRPIWDVYALGTGSYIRTQHVTGDITYYHTNNSTSYINTFEAVGWLADYDTEEIFIISREDEFSVGAGTYNGLILDLDGEFKDVFWRHDSITQDVVDAGFASTQSEADRRLNNMRTVAYRYPYFYVLTNPGVLKDEGTHIDMYRYGNNPFDPSNDTDVEFITSQEIGAVTGLSFVSELRPVETFTYCSADDLFYFTVRGDDEIHTMRITVEGQIPNETLSIARGPISETSLNQLSVSSRLLEGFVADTDTNSNNWDGGGELQQLRHFIDWVYVPLRDTFALLLNYRSDRTEELVREGEFQTEYWLFNHHYHSMIVEVAAETQGVEITTPKMPNQKDVLWGTLSGTLGYEQVQENSILFPTGRYAQLEYKLNSDPGRVYTPYLLESQVTQGLRVPNIPASGTKTIYLRTNIPEGESIGDQAAQLKVFWELEGD